MAVNLELESTERLLIGGHTVLGSSEPLVTFLSTDGYVPGFMCFCLKTPYVIYIAGSLILNSWPTAQQILP